MYAEYACVRRVRMCTQSTQVYAGVRRVRRCTQSTQVYAEYASVRRVRKCTQSMQVYAEYTVRNQGVEKNREDKFSFQFFDEPGPKLFAFISVDNI